MDVLLASHLGPFQESKVWLEDLVGLDKQSLHIIVGLLVFAGSLVIFRRRRWLSLVAVMAAALIGEVLDIYELLVFRGWRWEHIHWPWHYEDIIATAALPALLFLLFWLMKRLRASSRYV